MRQADQLLTREPDRGARAANVLLAAVLVLVTAGWLVALATGKLDSMRGLARPYLPAWFSLVNALLLPLTCAIAGLRAIPFRLNFIFAIVMLGQASLLGLTADDHPVVKAAVTILLYYEAFVLIPRWNHRSVETTKTRDVLNL